MRTKTALVTLGYCLSMLPTAAFAITEDELSETDKRAVFRPCQTVDSDQVERCKARQLARLKIATSGVRAIPTNAQDLYQRIDLGGALRRKQAERERLKELRELRKGRRTYREYDPTNDPNTAQASYIGDLRSERLACQLMPAGRPKSICFDEVAQKYRQIMKEQTGATKYPAQ